MDGVLCLWDNKGIRCNVLAGHKGSISQVLVDDRDIGISAGYDSQIITWNLASHSSNIGSQVMKGVHQQPVLQLGWQNSLVVSGDRGGQVVLWDINKGQSIR